MPGLSFVCDFNEDLEQKEKQFVQSLRSLVHSERYTSRVQYHDKSYFLGISSYEEYPFTVIENDKYLIYIEGKIYGQDQSLLNQDLQELADNIFIKRVNSKKELLAWLLRTDGDFVITMLEKKSREIIIFNDALGRLPLYYYQTPHGLYVSREIRFIINLLNPRRFDRMGIAQTLLFGYPLANRTLFEDVHRLPPATLVNIDLERSRIEIERLYTFNLDEKRYKDLSLEENTDNLCHLFLDGTKNRTNSDDKNVVALSGGLDSRLVAAGLHHLSLPFSGATYLDSGQRASDDLKIAAQLASRLNFPWKPFHLDSPTKKDAIELMKIKNGMNFVGMSFILPFFKSIQSFYGSRIVFFTGDGGDKTLPDLGPDKKISNAEELSDFIIKNNQIFSLEEVSSLTNLEQQEILSELKNRIMAYPEREWQNKYTHFLIFERGFKWLFEGEDRNRFYFWSVTPFYSLPFLIYAMNCPESIKRRYKLYQRFLLKISPEASSVPNASWRFPITSDFKLLLRTSVYPRLPLRFKGLIRNALKKQKIFNPVAENSLKDLSEQIKTCSVIKDYFSISELSNLENISQNKFDNLFTITSVIEEFGCSEK